MRLAAVMLVKNEDDIVEHTIRHLFAEGVERVYVSDNNSTDSTWGVLQDLAVATREMTVQLDEEVGYFQSAKTTALAHRALADGFDWVIPCDADEWWCSAFGSLRQVIERHDAKGFDVVQAQLWDHVPTGADDPDEPNPFRRIAWRFGRPAGLPKVACRLRNDLVIAMGNHTADFALPARVREDPALTIHHCTWRSEEQYVRKIRNGWAAYEPTGMPLNFGGHWRLFGPPDEPTWEERVRAHYREWFYIADPFVDRPDLQLVRDPADVVARRFR